MNNVDRPQRKRILYLTMEICRNRDAGPYGSIELIESASAEEGYPVYYYWPLNSQGAMDEAQFEDLGATILKDVTEALVTRLQVQQELFRSATTT